MKFIQSAFKLKGINPPVERSKVVRIEEEPANPSHPELWILFFYGFNDDENEKIVRTWFYNSEQMQKIELQILQEMYPSIKIR